MRIVHFAAGSGNTHCGACARDAALARALVERGHHLQVIPLYIPLIVDADALPTTPVFMGAINAYLQQLWPLLGRLPRFLARLLDHPALLLRVARLADRTDPSRLGPMQVSVLSGGEGRQREEFERLLGYLRSQPPPEVASITNSLLSAIAPELKRHFQVPVVCGLQGEEGFLEPMPEPYRSQAHELMRRNAEHIDRFIAPSEGYALEMAELLEVPAERMRVVRTGLDLQRFAESGPRVREPFTVGYLSVIKPSKGLHLLVEACGRLVQEEGRELVLRVGGQAVLKRYWRQIRREVAAAGLSERFQHVGEVDEAGKAGFLGACSALCLPSLVPEVRGTVAMEAMAAGVPVVVPASGVFPEMLELTGGGLSFPTGEAEGLAAAIGKLMDEPEAADKLGRDGAEGIARHFTWEGMVERLSGVFEELVSPRAGGGE